MKRTFTTAQNSISIISAVILLAPGIGWLFMPGTAMNVLGVALEGEGFPTYGYIKAMEDILPALAILLFLLQRNRQALRGALVLASFVAITDILFVWLAKGYSPGILMHLPYIILPLTATYLLRTIPAENPAPSA